MHGNMSHDIFNFRSTIKRIKRRSSYYSKNYMYMITFTLHTRKESASTNLVYLSISTCPLDLESSSASSVRITYQFGKSSCLVVFVGLTISFEKRIMANNSSSEMYENIFSLVNPAFCSYLFCTSVLVLKMMGTTLLVVFHRMRTKSFISDEDAAWQSGNTTPNDTVERARRACSNDLENIIMFLVMGLAYLSINPPLWAVNILFALYVVTRVLHTFVYAIYVIRQPVRAILWAIGFIITGYMATHTALYMLINGYLSIA